MKWKFIHAPPPTRLTIHQNRELNCLLDDYAQLGWPRRWRSFAFWTCLLAMVYLPLIELASFTLWLNDKPIWQTGIKIGVLQVLYSLVAVVVQEIRLRFKNRRKRKLELCLDGIHLGGGNFLPWSAILKWNLTRVPGETQLWKLRVEYDSMKVHNPNDISLRVPFRKRHVRKSRKCIILEEPEQTKAFQDELDAIRGTGRMIPELSAEITSLPEYPSQAKKPLFTGLALMLAAVWLFAPGIELLAFGFGMIDRAPSNQTNTAPMTRNERKLNRWLRQVFPTKEEAAIALLMTGGIMTGASVFLFVYSSYLDRRTITVPNWTEEQRNQSTP